MVWIDRLNRVTVLAPSRLQPVQGVAAGHRMAGKAQV
jgi:hypothetical protein